MEDPNDASNLYPGDTVKINSNNATSLSNQWRVINARFVPPSTSVGFKVILKIIL